MNNGAPDIQIKPSDVDKLIELCDTVGKLPVAQLSGEVKLPVHFSTGAGINFVVIGEKAAATRQAPAKPDRELNDFEQVMVEKTVNKIRELNSAGMKDADIAIRIGVSSATFVRWKGGHAVPRKKQAFKDLMALKVTPGRVGVVEVETRTRRDILKYCSQKSITRPAFCSHFQLDESKFEDFLNEDWRPENADAIMTEVHRAVEGGSA